jgi:hypothetical protein
VAGATKVLHRNGPNVIPHNPLDSDATFTTSLLARRQEGAGPFNALQRPPDPVEFRQLALNRAAALRTGARILRTPSAPAFLRGASAWVQGVTNSPRTAAERCVSENNGSVASTRPPHS